MPMKEQTKPGASNASFGAALLSREERLAAISAYLDGELTGDDLRAFEVLLRNDEALSREVAEMRRIDRQLAELGAEILSEPIPDALLAVLSGR